MVKLHNTPINYDVHVDDMKDGQIGIITNWDTHSEENIGRIVQRYQNILITIGHDSDESFTSIFDLDKSKTPNCRVRILQKGELIEII